MCTVLLRFDPAAPWPLLLAAVRDEFVDRSWDPPARHWGDDLVGGRDRLAGGTWLAVDPARPAVAAVLNGVPVPPLPLPPGGRPSRGGLPLAALRGEPLPSGAGLAGYDRFHLMLGTPTEVDVWSWDGEVLRARRLEPGDHLLVNLGVDTEDDPLVPHFRPLLRKAASPPLAIGTGTAAAWDGWVHLLAGDGLDPADPRALIVRRSFGARTYGSTSASLVALRPGAVRYDFTGLAAAPDWHPVLHTDVLQTE